MVRRKIELWKKEEKSRTLLNLRNLLKKEKKLRESIPSPIKINLLSSGASNGGKNVFMKNAWELKQKKWIKIYCYDCEILQK